MYRYGNRGARGGGRVMNGRASAARPNPFPATPTAPSKRKQSNRLKISLRCFLLVMFVLASIFIIVSMRNLVIHSSSTGNSGSSEAFDPRKKSRLGFTNKQKKHMAEGDLVELSRYSGDFETLRRARAKDLKEKLIQWTKEQARQLTACEVWKDAQNEGNNNKQDGAALGVEGMDITYKCRDASDLFVHNPSMGYDRYVCGTKLEPNSYKLVHNCKMPPRLFEHDPAINGQNMPPEVISSKGADFVNPVPFDQCDAKNDVKCHQAGTNGLITDWRVKDTPWNIKYSMEGSGYYHGLKVEPRGWKRNRFWATTSFHSEIPLPYFSWAEYDIHQPMLDYEQAIKGASFLAKNCDSNNDREGWVTNLTKVFRVDSLSSCLHNAEFPQGLSRHSSKAAIQQKYLFHLAFENTCETDYMTEKLWGTLASGTLAVHYGSENVKEHVPPNSVISVHDFEDANALGKYLHEVANNRTLYESYHKWRKEPLPASFLEKYNFTHTHSICRICRWTYAKRYGWGWDVVQQQVRDTLLSRSRVCIDAKHSMMQTPMEEVFFSGKTLKELAVQKDEKLCKKSLTGGPHGVSSAELTLNGWERTIFLHDGVVDITLEATSRAREVIYGLKSPFATTGVAEPPPRVEKEHAHYVLQNNVSRVNILIDPPSSVMFTDAKQDHSVLGIKLTHSRMRIRLVVADVDNFHEDATTAPSYFEEFTFKDFFRPVQIFRNA